MHKKVTQMVLLKLAVAFFIKKCPEPQREDFVELCGSEDYIPSSTVCATNTELCKDGLCIPTEDGSYRCECSAGYRFNEHLLICEGESFMI